jgi:hypothetical protein
MSYIVLRDTLGDGLKVVDLTDQPDVLSRSELDQYVAGLVDERIDDGDSVDLACESVVICEIINTMDGKDIRSYARRVYETFSSESKEERRALYLKLKLEFDPDA